MQIQNSIWLIYWRLKRRKTCTRPLSRNLLELLVAHVRSVDLGRFRFAVRFSGAPGQLVVTEMSSNLVEWIPFSTNFVSSAGQVQFVVPLTSEGSSKARFFRTRW